MGVEDGAANDSSMATVFQVAPSELVWTAKSRGNSSRCCGSAVRRTSSTDAVVPRSTVRLSAAPVSLPSDAHELVGSASPTLATSHDGPSTDEAVSLAGVRRFPLVSGGAAASDAGAPGFVRSGTVTLGTFDRALQVWVSSTVL